MLVYVRLVMRGGRQGQVLASTMPRTQNRAEKGSTLLQRRSTLAHASGYCIYVSRKPMLKLQHLSW